MRNPNTFFKNAFGFCFCVLLSSSAPSLSANTDTEEDTPVKSDQIVLQKAQQIHAGIRASTIPVTNIVPEIIADAEVLSIQPMLKLKRELAAAKSEVATAKIEAEAALKALQHAQSLYQRKALTSPRLRLTKAQQQSKQSLLQGAQEQLTLLHQTAIERSGNDAHRLAKLPEPASI